MCKDAVRASYCLKETAPGVGSNGKKTTVTQDSGQHRTRLTWAFGHSIKRKRAVWFVGTEMRCQVWSCVKPRSRSMANPPWHSGTIAIRSQVLPKCFSNHAQDISGSNHRLFGATWLKQAALIPVLGLCCDLDTVLASENPRQLCQGSKS